MTCDLCNGKPVCTQVCTTGALSYIPEGDLSTERKRVFGQVFLHAVRPR
jgi:Fe-S-cluster-containing hydrogenase component 2